jgi:hypothetical protein
MTHMPPIGVLQLCAAASLLFAIFPGAGYEISHLLLQKKMLYTTTQAENVETNITIATDNDNRTDTAG